MSEPLLTFVNVMVPSFIFTFWSIPTPSIPEVTFITHVAINPPSSVVANITAVPYPTQTTLPLLTIATDGLDELHITFLFVASLG